MNLPHEKLELLRDFLRDSGHWIDSTDPISRHRAVMQAIWEQGLKLANGNPGEALALCLEAVKSGRQEGETEEQYHKRLKGIPSRAFGEPEPPLGEASLVDKPQHFFAAAQLAYTASLLGSPRRGELFGKAMGKAQEVRDYLSDKFSDWLGKEGPRHGGYDRQDIVAGDRGAEFGAALAAHISNPLIFPLLVRDLTITPSAVPISNFLYGLEDLPKRRSRPGDFPLSPTQWRHTRLLDEPITRLWPIRLLTEGQ